MASDVTSAAPFAALVAGRAPLAGSDPIEASPPRPDPIRLVEDRMLALRLRGELLEALAEARAACALSALPISAIWAVVSLLHPDPATDVVVGVMSLLALVAWVAALVSREPVDGRLARHAEREAALSEERDRLVAEGREPLGVDLEG